MKLIDNIIRFEKHFSNAKKLKGKNISDYFIYNTLAMECFQAVNALIEIGEYIVTSRKLGFPSTYIEIFEILFQNGWMNKEELKSAKKLIFMRNLISHEYYQITENELLEMIDHLENVNKFVEKTKEA